MELIGREDELGLADHAIASALARRGRAVFVTGDAGLGKTAVLDAARARAEAAGLTVLAGAAWEAGGAPSYWPWLQVLRAAAAAFDVRDLVGAARIATLVPEWGEARAAEASDRGAERFALLDAVARALVALSTRAPIAVILDDLHAADLPSLDLLGLFARELPRAAIAVIGAWREGELATRPEVAHRLARAARHAEVRPLRRLTADEVGAWASRRGGDGAALFAFSEGNPLFVEEALRARHRGAAPAGVDAVLRDHLALVSPSSRAVLEAAAVLGRDAARSALIAIAGVDEDAVTAAMREAAAAGVVTAHAGGWTFTHVLLRDHVYAATPLSHRAALHRAAGLASDPADPTGGRAAHHRLRGAAGDPAYASEAIAAARAAADRATRLYAFEDGAALLDAAVGVLEGIGQGAGRDAAELRLASATARRSSGDTRAGQRDATAALGIARALGDPELLARAALEHAAELASGRRDPAMVEILEEATAALPSADTPIRARLLARLATALSPPIDRVDRRPLDMSEEAIAMARRLDDDDALLFALRFRGHTFGYLEPYTAQLEVCLESIAVADRLGLPLEAIEQATWMITLRHCLGDLAGSDRALDDVTALLAPYHAPQLRWRTPVLRAGRAILRGQLDEAARHAALARQLSLEHGIDRARTCVVFLALSMLQADPVPDRAADVIEEVIQLFGRSGGAAAGPIAFVHAVLGRDDEARHALATVPPNPALIISQLAIEAALRLGDREQAARLLPMVLVGAGHYPMAIGPAGSGSYCPADIVVGEALLLLDRRDEAIEHLERGLALARALKAPHYIARAERALPGAEREVRVPATASPVIRTDAERVRVSWRGRDHALAPSKGLAYLERLLDAAGQEVHVSELVGAEDRGDAGEILDARARDAYKARAIALRGDLDDAEARHDLGRAERARAELDALTEQLAGAVGLGGRSRRAASHVERARINVQRRIRDAIRRIAEVDAELGRYLEAAIRTGTFCGFAPLP